LGEKAAKHAKSMYFWMRSGETGVQSSLSMVDILRQSLA